MSALVKSRPVLFSAPMVLALLDGRKTQTRRTRGLQRFTERGDFIGMRKRSDGVWVAEFRDSIPDDPCPVEVRSPYGGPGDTLWVKETWRPRIAHSCSLDTCDCGDVAVSYAAGGRDVDFPDGSIPSTWTMPKAAARGNVSPLLMPRWASRITLEVTGVRVERLQDISQEDAKAEGLKGVTKDGALVKYGLPDRDGWPGTDDLGWEWRAWEIDPRRAFHRLWESINGADSWSINPWVWVVSFKVVTP